MARLSFGIFGQDSNSLLSGLLVKIKDVDSGVFVASTNPEGAQLRIYDNNDGTYFVDGLPSGLYSVYVNSETNVQEELQNIPFYNEDVKAHMNNLAIHRSINDTGAGANDLWSAAKIMSELAVKASQGDLEILETEVSGKADEVHSHDYLPATQVSSDFAIENGVLKYKPSFSIESILSESKSLNQNLELLQAAILNVVSGGGNRRQLYADVALDTSPSGTLTYPVYSNNMLSSYVDILLMPYRKLPGDIQVTIYFEMMVNETPTVPIAAKLSVGAVNQSAELRDENWSGTYGAYSLTVNVSALSSGFYDLRFQIINANDALVNVRKIVVVVE